MTTGILAFCAHCRSDQMVDPLSRRCLTCAHSTGRTVAEAQNGAAPKPQEGIKLPATNASRRWLEGTRALAASFTKAAEEAEGRARKATAEAERLRKAAAAFTGLLPQVSVDEGLPKATTGAALNGRWSRAHERCVSCGRVDRPHKAKGLCSACHHKSAEAKA